MLYYAAFVPGMQSVAADIIKTFLKDGVIKKLLDGAVVFESAAPYSRVNFSCFNNLFAALDVFTGSPQDRGNLIDAQMRRMLGRKKIGPVNKEARSFRIVCSDANRLVRVNENLKRDMEDHISQKTGLLCNRSRPDTEFWFLRRSEGFSIFMERLTKHRSFDKTLHRGELSPQLAWMMCWLSKPRKEDVVLDPFCGYGAIPGQRINRFPLKKMYAFDRDEGALKCTRSKLKGEERCDIRKLDFRDIPSALPEKSVDTIITDPPWGMFEETDIPLEKFYAAMIRGFRRVLKDQGRVVILTAAKEEFLAALKASGGPGELELRESLQVLVSGKKAGLFSLTFSRP